VLGVLRGVAARLHAAVRAAVAARPPPDGLAPDQSVAAGEYRLMFAPDGALLRADERFRAWWSAHYGDVPETSDELLAALRRAAPGTAVARHLLPVNLALAGLQCSEVLAMRTPRGRRRIQVRAAPVMDRGGRVHGAVTIWRDLGWPSVPATWARLTGSSESTSSN
jgi:hypothetical protein